MNKQFLKYLWVLPLMLTTSCKDEVVMEYIPQLSEGGEVRFKFKDSETRTMYADNWDATETGQILWWGNYLPETQGQKDKVKVFCYQGTRKVGTYTVETQNTNSQYADSLSKIGDAGVQWGPEGTDHTFYAVYPADLTGDNFIDAGKTIRATINPGQSPVTYSAVSANTTHSDNALDWVLGNSTAAVANQTVIYGQPDMSAALMVATTTVSGTPDAATQTGYGYPVDLKFNVLADVLDLTINGPVTPNKLGGNSNQSESRPYIKILNVYVENTKQTPITGTFDLDLATGEASNITGDSRIQLQTAQVTSTSTLYPTLYARVNKNTAPTSDEIDHLRVRAFLVPGSVENLEDLKITVVTDCGEYSQTLASMQMVSGKIHRINLKYFNTRGTEFDFTRWIAQLDPNIYVNELSLPGTWHSTSPNNQGTYTDLKTQLDAGIRAFEVHATNSVKNGQNNVASSVTYNATTPSGDWHSVPTETANSTSYSNPLYSTTTSPSSNSTRTVTATRTYTQTETTNEYQFPDVYIPVANTLTNTDLYTSISSLQSQINDGEFVVIEIGSEGQYSETINYTNVKTTTRTRTGTIQVTGTQKPTRINNRYSWPSDPETNTTWNDVDENNIVWGDWSAPETKTTNNTSVYLNAGTSWALAVSSTIKKLATDGKIYSQAITPNTTISDVSNNGKIIIKVNTNDAYNETGWYADTPAIFSRWTDGSGLNPITEALKWGQAIAPDGSSNMKWCFTEHEVISGEGEEANPTVGTIWGRKHAIDQIATESYNQYTQGEHDTWFECSIGGFYGSNTATNCETIATKLNPYLLQVLSNPNRQATPFGLVFINYALGTSSDANAYYGEDLIRTIINNNSAFILRRKGGAKASDDNDAIFNNNSGNAVKP